jgi:hypothetical protein
MHFEFFEGLSPADASQFLSNFLQVGSDRFPKFADARLSEGVQCDFSLGSIAPLMFSILPKLVSIPLRPDPSVPSWIRNTESYRDNLFDFDLSSKELIVTTSYYFGECFVRTFPQLRWATGDPETAQMNMPVVTGFRNGVEMAVMMICENLFARVFASPSKRGDFEIAIATWKDKVPQTAGVGKQAKGRE